MDYSSQLLYQFKQGDMKAFRKLFEEFYPRLCSFAFKYLQDDQLSEDIVQEVLSDLWDKRQSVTIKVSLKSFLYTSVKNRCLNFISKDKNEKKRFLDYVCFASDSVDDYNFIEEEVHANLHKAIKNLPEKSQKVILLSMQEMSNVEIQEELNVSVNTVKSNKRRAYKMLRDMLR
ncbi:RNA polymerase sigma-70 factor [Ancylomarina sp. DW003]|nr:RNA polymerase sigma-70 factor [Ancylomarina sp. DW003]MDE5422014.1 RNA polymerase sigma-70 factor [Ancylomarina sp. DW003]